MKKVTYGKKWKMALGTACLTVAGMAALTGCSGSSSSSTSSDGTVELEILLADDTLEGGAMQAMVDKFNEEHADQGVQAYVNEIAYADMETQIKICLLSAKCPILILM